MQPKAIETDYAGIKFRSRIEARWAIFYESIGVDWHYEPEGFEFKHGRYLPDFFINDIDSWIEIKGAHPTDRETQLAWDLAEFTKKKVYVFYGAIPWPPSDFRSTSESAFALYPTEPVRMIDGSITHAPSFDSWYRWCQCPTCDKYGIQFEGRGNRICRHPPDEDVITDDTESILSAYKKARSKRF